MMGSIIAGFGPVISDLIGSDLPVGFSLIDRRFVPCFTFVLT